MDKRTVNWRQRPLTTENKQQQTKNGSTGAYPHTRGVFGGISYDRFTLMGELDIAGKGNDSVLSYASLNTRLEYGLYFIAEYNFFDPDKHTASGVEEFVRLLS